jgi:MFS family permease
LSAALVEAPVAPSRARLALKAVSEVFKNPGLRNLQISSSTFVAGEWAYTVALGVYAYEYGGPAWVGIVGFIRMVPAAFGSPLVGALADRYARERVLLFTYIARAVALAASAAAAIGKVPVLVFCLAGVVTVVSAATRPCEWTLRGTLARTPEELAATNAAGSMVEGVSSFVGPALAGVLLVKTSAGVVFLVTSQMSVVGAIALASIRTFVKMAPCETPGARTLAREGVEGIATVARERDTRILFSLIAGQTFTRGALNVLIVVAAIRLLHMGDPGVGYLNSAFGVGNLIGAFAALVLVGRRKLAGPAGIGLILWGAPIALVALAPFPAVALIAFAIPGLGNGIFDVAILTILQRITSDEMHGRVFGTLETTAFAFIAVGSILTPLLVAGFGIGGALGAVGLFLPALTLLLFPRLRDIDSRAHVPEHEVAVLRATPLFASLPAITLDRLAQHLKKVEAHKGNTIIREGDVGDSFYVIDKGHVRVRPKGRTQSILAAGDYFGEIALIRQVPRSATVTAMDDVTLYLLDGASFLAAVTRDERSDLATREVASARLAD